MSNEISKNLKEQISLLENVPGVYQFYDISESLLYVGKALPTYSKDSEIS